MVIDNMFGGPGRHLGFPLLSRKYAPMEDRGSDPLVGCLLDSEVGEHALRAFTVGSCQ